MANPRLYLWIALALLAWLNLVQWNRDFDRPAGAVDGETQLGQMIGAGLANAG